MLQHEVYIMITSHRDKCQATVCCAVLCNRIQVLTYCDCMHVGLNYILILSCEMYLNLTVA